MSTVNERMKELRKLLNYNQENFSKEVGISRAHISNIENGNDNPSTSLIKLICYKFNVDEEWLISGKGSAIPDYDNYSDDGLQAKYMEMRVMFERWLKMQSGEQLKISVQAFSYFISILTSKNLTEKNKSEYLSNVSSITDELEKFIFRTYLLNTYVGKKQDYKLLLNYKSDADKTIEIIDDKIKGIANIYLEQYKIDVKL